MSDDVHNDVVVTMGVEQVPGGLAVCVLEWARSGAQTVFFAGTLQGSSPEMSLLGMMPGLGVRRALVSPAPDDRIARSLVQLQPEVFAIQGGSEHNAASLAELAYRRMTLTDQLPPGYRLPLKERADWHLIGVGVTVGQRGAILRRGERGVLDVHVSLPDPARPVPTHVVLPINEASVLQAPDGSRMIEASVDIDAAVPIYLGPGTTIEQQYPDAAGPLPAPAPPSY